jgi:retinol-binding protein 3
MKGPLLSLLLGLVIFLGRLSAQTSTNSGLDAKARADVIDALTRELNRAYVFPDKATAIERDLRARQSRKAYDAISDAGEFARLLTEHLQAITKDKHLRVGAGAPPSSPPTGGGGRPPAFGESRRLDGNVAYVQINSFGFPPAQVRESTRTIMSEAADAAALIIDVRTNGGGHPGMVALVSSYLFGEEPVHLNSLYWRTENRTEDFYTDPKVEGKKFGATKPVYVLTSARTFSAAEEFTYNLQSRKRAIIVGETTGGGAHPGGGVTLPHGMRAFIPSGRAINPITKTNWEGVGVKPDFAVPADGALEAAHKLARAAAQRTN